MPGAGSTFGTAISTYSIVPSIWLSQCGVPGRLTITSPGPTLRASPPFTPTALRIVASGLGFGYGSLSIVGGISVPPVTRVPVPFVTMMYSTVRVWVIAYCGPLTRRRTTPGALPAANGIDPPVLDATSLGSSAFRAVWISAALMYGDGSRSGGTLSCPGFI